MSKTPSLSQAYSPYSGANTPLNAELRMAQEEVSRLQEANRVLDSKLTVRNLALRQMLSLLEHEVRNRTNLSEALKNIRKLLEDA